MRVTVLKKDNRYDIKNDAYLGIQSYGEYNDYPQQVEEVVKASGTGKTCIEVYFKFVFGKGFRDSRLYSLKLNRFGQTADAILELVAKDYTMYGGFALHFNWNRNFSILEIQHVPLETIRFEKMPQEGTFKRVALHPDWGKRYQKLRRWDKKDILWVDLFDPDPDVISQQVEDAGGWSQYAGQVYYYSNGGKGTYPTPLCDTVLTDMNTEEGISNVSNRNVRNNFMPSGMLVDFNNMDETEEQESSTEADLLEYQGDENAGKLMYVQCKSKDEMPQFVPFIGGNFSSAFTTTEKSVETKIGKAFNQPPILRAETVSANFGADVMKQAYNYYNSVTDNERLLLERVFTEIFSYWNKQLGVDFRISPLSYESQMTFAERIGDSGVTQLINIMTNEKLDENQKRQCIRVLFSPTPEELDGLIPSTI